MGKGIEPKLVTCMLSRDVDSSYCNGKTIGGFTTRICSSDFGIIVVDLFDSFAADELGVEIGVELPEDAIRIGTN